MNLFERSLVRLLSLWLKATFAELQVEYRAGSSLNAEQLKEIQVFRQTYLQHRHPYLFDEEHCKYINEDHFDAECFHLTIRYKNRMIATNRLSHAKFEAAILLKNINLDQYNDYIEISRAVIDPSFKGIGQILFLWSGIYCATTTTKKGFIALTQEKLLSHYEAFGLEIMSRQLKIPYRGQQEYFLIGASFNQMAKMALKNKFLKTRYQSGASLEKHRALKESIG